MTAHYSDQDENYANFRFFSETLLAGVLAPEFEVAIMNYRESHRGTMTGMTRFRDVLDDMPILGYGWGDLYHDRMESFHTLLAGHSANYLSRGTFWATEQRTQLDTINDKYRNGGSGGETGSLCMVSAIPTAMWVRWALVQEVVDTNTVHVARGAPRRWYSQDSPLAVTDAPTRYGLVSYQLVSNADSTLNGSVRLTNHPGASSSSNDEVRFSVRIRSATGGTLQHVQATGAKVVSVDSDSDSAVFLPTSSDGTFTFVATFQSEPSQAVLI